MAWQIDPEVIRRLAEKEKLSADTLNRIFGGGEVDGWNTYPHSLKNYLSHLDESWAEHDFFAKGVSEEDIERPLRIGAALNLPEDDTPTMVAVSDKVAVQTSVSNLWTGVNSANWFGADPDGNPATASANTAAIQNAVDAALASSGLTKVAEVFLPAIYSGENVYYINDTITLGHALKLWGAPGVVLKLTSGLDKYALEIDDAITPNYRTAISGFIIDGNGSGGGIDISPSNNSAGYVDISDMEIHNTETGGGSGLKVGISIDGPVRCVFLRGIKFEGCRSAMYSGASGPVILDRCFSKARATWVGATWAQGFVLASDMAQVCNSKVSITEAGSVLCLPIFLSAAGTAFNNDIFVNSQGEFQGVLASQANAKVVSNSIRVVGQSSETSDARYGISLFATGIVSKNKIAAASDRRASLYDGVRVFSSAKNCRVIANVIGGKVRIPINDLNASDPGDGDETLTTDNRVTSSIAVVRGGFGAAYQTGEVKDSWWHHATILEQPETPLRWEPIGRGLTYRSSETVSVKVADIVRAPWGLVAAGGFLRKGYAQTHESGGAEVGLKRVARWHGSDWVPLHTGDTSSGYASESGLNAFVYALIVDGESVYMAGSFNDYGSVSTTEGTHYPLAYSTDGQSISFTEEGPTRTTGTSPSIRDLAFHSQGLIFAGAFDGLSNQTSGEARGVALYNTKSGDCSFIGRSNAGYGPVGLVTSPDNLTVRSVSVSGGRITIGGDFSAFVFNNTRTEIDVAGDTFPLCLMTTSGDSNSWWEPLSYGGFLAEPNDTPEVKAVLEDAGLVLVGGRFNGFTYLTAGGSVAATVRGSGLLVFSSAVVSERPAGLATTLPEFGMAPLPLSNLAPSTVESIERVSTADQRFPSGAQYLVSGRGFVALLGFLDGDPYKPVWREITGPGGANGNYYVAKQIDDLVFIGGEFTQGAGTLGGAYGRPTNLYNEGIHPTIGGET